MGGNRWYENSRACCPYRKVRAPMVKTAPAKAHIIVNSEAENRSPLLVKLPKLVLPG